MFNKNIAIVLFFIMMFFSACDGGGGGGSDVNRTIDETATGWTVMVWLDADNNLESAAMEDLNEMEYGLYLASLGDSTVTDKIKIIVQVDRHSSYDNSSEYTGSNWTDTRRYIIRPDSVNSGEWISQRIDNNLGELNMGNASNLKNFIEYCQEHFPAPKYALILWNHGGGLRKKTSSLSSLSLSKSVLSSVTAEVTESSSKAICWDETDSDDCLYTAEITDVLTDAHSVDFLGFDACLMGMLEVAYEYRPGVSGKFGADAISFSPASEQGDGWDYERIFNRLSGADTDGDTADVENDACYDADALTANEFASLAAKEYADNDSTYGDNTQTQTAIDNTKVTDVKAKLDAFADAIPVGSYSNLETIRGSGSSVSTMHYFDESDVVEWISCPFFDLYDFADGAESNSIAATEALALKNAIKGFILYSYGGSSYSGFTNDQNGLSFFFTDGDATYSGTEYILYEWWYTSANTNTWWPGGHYYGKLDFCNGDNDGIVENWFELMMYMYRTSGLEAYHPGPGY